MLATEVTKELRLEGFAREVVHHVNTIRKDVGLAFDDRITLIIEADGEIAEAVEVHAESIKAETLAVELRRSGDAVDLQTLEVDGEPVKIGVIKR